MAINDADDALRGRSFTSARQAKLAVEDMLRTRRRSETLAEYAQRASELMRGEHFQATSITNQRQIPPPNLTPEEAAANRAAAAAVQRAPGSTKPPPGPPPPTLVPTEEGAAVEALRPPGQPRNFDAYARDYQAWKDMEARSLDESLTQAERNKAKRTARSMGGAFTQKNGKHYNRHAAEQVMAEDAAHQLAVESDEAVVAAQQKLDRAVANADAQVESMVYTKHHNPITGEDEYTRLPAGSTIGFGEGTRTAVPIEVPTQGQVPTGMDEIMPSWADRPPRTRPPVERQADRDIIDSGISAMMMPENQRAYDELTLRKQGIQEQLTNAARNEDRLRQLDDAAKAAYTGEVKAADKAVLDAKRVLAKAEQDFADGNVMGAGLAVQEAKRHVQSVVDAQTAVRQQWMDADRAWKAALAERDEYLKTRQAVTRAEQALHAHSNDSDRIMEAVRRGEDVRIGGHAPNRETRNLIQNLQRADVELDAMEASGRTFLTDVQRRDLAGQLNSIDLSQRDLIRQMSPFAVGSNDVLPQRDFAQERIESITRPDTNLARFGDEGQSPYVPEVIGTGQDPLTSRAYAESFNPVEPGERVKWGINEQGALQGRPELRGRQPYNPRTEREAIAGIEKQAADIEASPAGDAMRREEANIGRQMTAERSVAEERKAEIDLLGRAERDEKLLPIRDQVQTYVNVKEALDAKQKLIPKRDAAAAQRKRSSMRRRRKKADLVKRPTRSKRSPSRTRTCSTTTWPSSKPCCRTARDEATRGQRSGPVGQAGAGRHRRDLPQGVTRTST